MWRKKNELELERTQADRSVRHRVSQGFQFLHWHECTREEMYHIEDLIGHVEEWYTIGWGYHPSVANWLIELHQAFVELYEEHRRMDEQGS